MNNITNKSSKPEMAEVSACADALPRCYISFFVCKEVYQCANQFKSSTSPPPGNPLGIWTFEDWLVQIPSPRGKKAVQMPHQLVLNYLSSKRNFVFNQTLYHLSERRMLNDNFKLLLKTLLKELFTNKGEILSCKSVKPCKNRKRLMGVLRQNKR